MSTKVQREITHKLRVFEHAEKNKNVAFTCRYFWISRDTFYCWKKNYKNKGEQGLINSKPGPKNLTLCVPRPFEEKILYLHKKYHFAQLPIRLYLSVIMQLKYQLKRCLSNIKALWCQQASSKST